MSLSNLKAFVNWKTLLVTIGIVILDLIVYVFLGLLLMSYEDFYDAMKLKLLRELTLVVTRRKAGPHTKH